MMLARVASRYSPRVLRPVAVATFTAGPAWVPGIGKGKTSTGLVRRWLLRTIATNHTLCVFVCVCVSRCLHCTLSCHLSFV